MKTQPYRSNAAPLSLSEASPCGLVRANGSRCTCNPPGLIWCWWYDVREEDRWFCAHGGEWVRVYDYGKVLFVQQWKTVRRSEGEER